MRLTAIIFFFIFAFNTEAQTLVLKSFNLPDCPVGDDRCEETTINRQSFIDASLSDYVQVTETEWNNARDNMPNTIIAGMPEVNFNGAESAGWSGNTSHALQVSATTGNVYLLGFKMAVESGVATSGVKLKYSTSQTTGFTNFGNVVPDTAGDVDIAYYLYKGNTSVVNASGTYWGLYLPQGSPRTAAFPDGLYASGDVGTINNTFGIGVKLQVLLTTSLNW